MTGDGDLVACNKNHVFEVTCKTVKSWVVKQRLPTVKEVAESALMNFGNSLYYGMIIESYFLFCRLSSPVRPLPKLVPLCGPYNPMVESFFLRGYLEKTRNLAIMSGCKDSISFVMKNIKGKEDIQTSMVEGFCSGVVISLVTGMRGPSVISVGVLCMLVNTGMFKVGLKF